MLYIIDTQGTTQAVITEPVYKGSVGVNNITLLAPFPANTQILVSAILPNGMALRNLYPMKAVVLPVELQNINKKNYTAFSCTIDESLTLYSGTVQVQFQLINGFMTYVIDGQTKLRPRVLATYTTGFAVGEGINIESVSINEIGDQDYMQAILGLLSEINSDPIKSVEYRTSPEYLINSVANLPQGASVSVFPSGFTFYDPVPLTLAGMTENIGTTGYFVDFYGMEGENEVGFEIDLGAIKDISLIQLYIISANTDIAIKVSFGDTAGNYTNAYLRTIEATTTPIPVIPRFSFTNSAGAPSARYVKVTFNVPVVVQGIQIYEPNLDGEYVITFNSGAVAVIDACDGREVQRLASEAKESANKASASEQQAGVSAENAEQAYQNTVNLGNSEGGYPKLIEVDGALKIPSQFINQVDIKEYIQITSESELNTIAAQVGDVAVLVEIVDGVKTVAKSWLLLGIDSDGVRDWAVYGTSYASNAGNAQIAQVADRALTIGTAEKSVSLEGVYTSAEYNALVLSGAVQNNTIYFVEV